MKRILAAMAATAIWAAPGAADQGDEAGVRTVAAALEAAWAANDADAFAAQFAEDADITLPRGLRLAGRTEIRDGHEGVFSTIYEGTRIQLDVQRVRFLTPDIALGLMNAMIHSAPDGEAHGSADQPLLATMLVQRLDGEWTVQYFQTLPAAPDDFVLPGLE